MRRTYVLATSALVVAAVACIFCLLPATALAASMEISGTATYNGVGVAGVQVEAWEGSSGGPLALPVVTAADGTYHIAASSTFSQTGIAPVSVKIVFTRTGFGRTWWNSKMDWYAADAIPWVDGGTPTADQVLVKYGAAEGTITVPAGYATANALGPGSWPAVVIQFYRQSAEQWLNVPFDSSWTSSSRTAMSFSIPQLAPGTYRVLTRTIAQPWWDPEASAGGGDTVPMVYPSVIATSVDTSGAADVTVAADATATVNMTLIRGGHIVGTLTDKAGHPLTGTVTAYTSGVAGLARSFVNHTVISNSGSFVMEGLLQRSDISDPVMTTTGDYVMWVEPDDTDHAPFWYGGTTKFNATVLHVHDTADTTVTLRSPIRPFTLSTPWTANSSATRGRSFYVYGSILPMQPAGQRTVVLTFDHREHGRWVYKSSVTTDPSKYIVRRRYYQLALLTTTGEWRIRAKHRDVSHPKTVYSAGYAYVTVN